jgi:hypothetical protein
LSVAPSKRPPQGFSVMRFSLLFIKGIQYIALL